MQALVFLLLVSATCTTFAVPVLENVLEHEYPRYVNVPDGNGVMHTVDLEEQPDIELLNEIQRDPANNLYLLFTRRNPDSAQRLIINDASSIRSSNFNRTHPTVFIVHGWLGNQNTGINPLITDAYLGKGNTNVIVLDWRRLALSGYVTAASGVPAVGRGLGQFVRFLIQVTGIRYSSLHLVGFSLGAHLVGNAGRELEGKVARITGLDPAGPLWSLNPNKISPNDGVYVEAIHTDGGYTAGGIGIGTAVALVDFFPNGGISQPGCLTNVCNHNRAWELFAATVTYNHLIGRRCSNTLQISMNSCRGPSLAMGNDDLAKTGSGMYRVNTDRNYPY